MDNLENKELSRDLDKAQSELLRLVETSDPRTLEQLITFNVGQSIDINQLEKRLKSYEHKMARFSVVGCIASISASLSTGLAADLGAIIGSRFILVYGASMASILGLALAVTSGFFLLKKIKIRRAGYVLHQVERFVRK